MANSSAAAKTGYHTRSISLPSRSHPQTANLENQLCRLRSSSTASTSSSSSICHNLGLLNEMYESFNELLQFPHAQQAFAQCHEVEKALDGTLRLLDICSMSKDALLIVRESLQQLESSLRRRKGGESGLEDEVQSFQVSKKNVKRIVNKCFKNMNKMESFMTKIKVQGENPEHVALNTVLRDVEAVSLPILRSILSFMFGTEAKSLLSILTKQTGKQGEVMEKMNEVLEALKGKKPEKIEMKSIDLMIGEFEEGLECLFRRLLKSRVSLLNILNH